MMTTVLAMVMKVITSWMAVSILYWGLSRKIDEVKAEREAKRTPRVKITRYTPGEDDIEITECEVLS